MNSRGERFYLAGVSPRSEPLPPGSSLTGSPITAARHDHITRHLREAGLGALADLGFVSLDDDPDDAPVIITGRKATRSHRLTDAEKEANHLVSRERTAVEHAFANLKTWRILTKVRMNVGHGRWPRLDYDTAKA
ncbi:transposase family protein [Streptomyces sp. NPDC086554]|uniref:transposase family protein n=1 Tax=Streptomyces sp. NPDC086554 TaxID=3154864 RepID=UPI00342F4D66